MKQFVSFVATPVLAIISAAAFMIYAIVALCALVFSIVVSIPLGIMMGLNKDVWRVANSWIDRLIDWYGYKQK